MTNSLLWSTQRLKYIPSKVLKVNTYGIFRYDEVLVSLWSQYLWTVPLCILITSWHPCVFKRASMCAAAPMYFARCSLHEGLQGLATGDSITVCFGAALQAWQAEPPPGSVGGARYTCSITGSWHAGFRLLPQGTGRMSERVSVKGSLEDHGWALSSSGLPASVDVGPWHKTPHVINVDTSHSVVSLAACLFFLFFNGVY